MKTYVVGTHQKHLTEVLKQLNEMLLMNNNKNNDNKDFIFSV